MKKSPRCWEYQSFVSGFSNTIQHRGAQSTRRWEEGGLLLVLSSMTDKSMSFATRKFQEKGKMHKGKMQVWAAWATETNQMQGGRKGEKEREREIQRQKEKASAGANMHSNRQGGGNKGRGRWEEHLERGCSVPKDGCSEENSPRVNSRSSRKVASPLMQSPSSGSDTWILAGNPSSSVETALSQCLSTRSTSGRKD